MASLRAWTLFVALLVFACGGKGAEEGHAGTGGAGTASGGAGGAGSGGTSGAAGKGGAHGAIDAGKGADGASGSGGTSGSGGATGSGGTTGSGGSAADAGIEITDWHKASLTTFTSYPDPGSDECIKYNGCMWEGQFAGIDGKQTQAWVMAHNIAAVHSKDFAMYKLKTLRLRQGDAQIDVTVYDECADSDCDGCCTENAKPSGFLIDVESYTAERFGVSDGQVDWACLDCQ